MRQLAADVEEHAEAIAELKADTVTRRWGVLRLLGLRGVWCRRQWAHTVVRSGRTGYLNVVDCNPFTECVLLLLAVPGLQRDGDGAGAQGGPGHVPGAGQRPGCGSKCRWVVGQIMNAGGGEGFGHVLQLRKPPLYCIGVYVFEWWLTYIQQSAPCSTGRCGAHCFGNGSAGDTVRFAFGTGARSPNESLHYCRLSRCRCSGGCELVAGLSGASGRRAAGAGAHRGWSLRCCCGGRGGARESAGRSRRAVSLA